MAETEAPAPNQPGSIATDEQFPIIAAFERPIAPLRVLKCGECFAVFDHRGDVVQGECNECGLYCDGTRFLSHLELLLFGHPPLLLSSTLGVDDAVFEADLANPDVLRQGQIVAARGEIHVHRSRAIWGRNWVERISIENFRLGRIDVPLSIRFDADFVDVFEVRGTRRARRGERLPDRQAGEYVMAYRGLDALERRTTIRWSRTPDRLERGRAAYILTLEPREMVTIEFTVSCETERHVEVPLAVPGALDEAMSRSRARHAEWNASSCRVFSSSDTFHQWVTRSSADLRMMETETPYGAYPYAGIPWFSAPFGRDGLITAFEMLWLRPSVARGVLAFLAETQAADVNVEREAEPGKILHEMRSGEMATLGEVPFGRYYGSCDATPLFVMLAHAYYERTADREFLERLWPHVVRALEWMQTSGDPDGDGFLEYARHGSAGLINQGWKDSHDSIFHDDGSLAEGPVAVCEVQGYAYAAWRGAAALAAMRGDTASWREWTTRAERLREQFELAFWCEELDTYALALDGHRRPCRVRTSNPGHCLFAGIVSPERARRLCGTLMGDALFAGWGVRTVAAGERRYNPQSYHNGSIWPHDNAIIAAGLARYGFAGAATRLLTSMLELSEVSDLHRLPELICGFQRRGRAPTLYPVACAPQAWSAGAAFMLLGAAIGVQIDAPSRRVSFSRGQLPEGLDWIRLTGLAVGDAQVDLQLERHPHDLGVTVLRRDGDVEIVTVK